MKVYAILKAGGDADANLDFDFVGVAANKQAAKMAIHSMRATLEEAFRAAGYLKMSSKTVDIAHPSMKSNNDFTYFGKREDCDHDGSYVGFAGYVVEETEVFE